MSKTKRDYSSENLQKVAKRKGYTLVDISNSTGRTSVILTCDNCGYTSNREAASLFRGSGKIRCKGCPYITHKELQDKLSQMDRTVNSLLPSFIKSSTRVNVVCSKGHENTIRVADAIRRKCKVCSGKEALQEDVVTSLKQLGFTLESEYKGTNKTATLKHVNCNRLFTVNVLTNTLRGSGCPHCTHRTRKDEEQITEGLLVNGWKLISEWDSLQDYTRSLVRVSCIDCDYTREGVLGNYIYKGITCPRCNERKTGGFKGNLRGILYYVKFSYDSKYYYKIGVTNLTPEERFAKEKCPYEVIHTESYDTGYDARKREQEILKGYSEYRYKGVPFLESGNTEIFTKDVLELDT